MRIKHIRRELNLAIFVCAGLLVTSSACSKDTVDPEGTTTRGGGDGDGESGRDEGDTKPTADEDDTKPTAEDETWSEEQMEVRECMGCWEEHAADCGVELEACKASLACSQLMDCPYACGATAQCVAECQAIIPTGVELLTEFVQCIACDGGPCEADCQTPSVLAYCE